MRVMRLRSWLARGDLVSDMAPKKNNKLVIDTTPVKITAAEKAMVAEYERYMDWAEAQAAQNPAANVPIAQLLAGGYQDQSTNPAAVKTGQGTNFGMVDLIISDNAPQVLAAQKALAQADALQSQLATATPGSPAYFRLADQLASAKDAANKAVATANAAGGGSPAGGGGSTGTGGTSGGSTGTIGVTSTGSVSSAPTAPTGPTLAMDTFRSTLALMFGDEAKMAAWVSDLYNVVSKYYKTGSSMSEALNLSLQDARSKPELKRFTDRFKGVFDLQDRLQKGEAVYVPTIAEYTQIQTKMGEVFNAAGLGELASLEFTGTLIGKNLSAATVSNYITNVFDTIDNADVALKKTMAEYFPMVTRADLAKTLLLGDQGVQELEQKIKGIQVKSAAQQQGLMSTDPFNLAKMGVTYAQAQSGYSNIAQNLQTFENLQERYGMNPPGTASAMQTLEAATFGGPGKAEAVKRVQTAARKERNVFSGSTGVTGSTLLAGETVGAL